MIHDKSKGSATKTDSQNEIPNFVNDYNNI